MSDREEEERSERSRPRIVDKRRSARPASTPPSDPPPAAAAPPPPPVESPANAAPAPGPEETPGPPAGAPGDEQVWTPEQEAAAQQMARELAERPSSDWVLNIAVTLANVAGAKIEVGQPEDARLAIDTLEAIVNAVAPQLAGAEAPLRQTLAQLQIAFAQSIQNPPAP